MTMLGIVLAGLLGTMVGSWITYGIGRGGRLEADRTPRLEDEMDPHPPAQIGRAERWFERYGEPVVCFGRMVPLIRAFVSLPAGIARMPFWRFSVLSLLGSIPWVVALAFAGRALGSDWTTVRKGFQYVDYLILLLIITGIIYAVVRARRGGSPDAASEAGVGVETGVGAAGRGAEATVRAEAGAGTAGRAGNESDAATDAG